MSDLQTFDFNVKKILKHAQTMDDKERIGYLKKVISEYKISAGIFETEFGVGLRMPEKLRQKKLIADLEKHTTG